MTAVLSAGRGTDCRPSVPRGPVPCGMGCSGDSCLRGLLCIWRTAACLESAVDALVPGASPPPACWPGARGGSPPARWAHSSHRAGAWSRPPVGQGPAATLGCPPLPHLARCASHQDLCAARGLPWLPRLVHCASEQAHAHTALRSASRLAASVWSQGAIKLCCSQVAPWQSSTGRAFLLF